MDPELQADPVEAAIEARLSSIRMESDSTSSKAMFSVFGKRLSLLPITIAPGMLRRIATTTDFGKFIADAPVCVLVLCRDTKYYLEDGSAATENILLAARAHGLGSCWVAGDKKPYAAEICRLAGAPPDYKLVSLIPIGYPAESPEKSKRPLSDVLHWEKY